MQRVEKRIEIDAPIERVFDLFSDFENFPRWMRHIRDVHYSGRRYTRWKADAPLGTSVEWEAETTAFDPPHLIAWRSVRGDVDTEGEVTFRETRRGTTLMDVRLGYRPPAGRLGALVASLFGKDPEQQLEEDLWRFAEVAERSQRREERRRREERAMRERRDVDRGYRDDAPRRRPRPLDEEEQRRRLVSNLRPDNGERGRRMDFDEEWDERLGRPARRRREVEEEEQPRRHALTPREREREQRERKPDSGYSREAFRRGVDRLMDEPPSRDWRRWD